MLEQFEQYFKAMKVEAVPKHAVENVIVDFYLPETYCITLSLEKPLSIFYNSLKLTTIGLPLVEISCC